MKDTGVKNIVGVLVASDTRSSGDNEDLTGPAAAKALEELGYAVAINLVVPDDLDQIAERLELLCKNDEIELVLTCGGTGLSPRDVTPEATISILEKAVPGIPQLLRAKSLEITPNAALGRGVAGICNNTLVINLPGSPKAVTESIGFLAPILEHAIETVAGRTSECAR